MKTIRQLMTALLLLISIEGFGQSAGPAQTICISNTVITAATGSGTWVPLSSNVHEVYFDNLNYSLAADTISGFSVAGRYGFLWNNDTLWVTVVNCDTAAGTQTICESNSDTVSMHATGTGTWSALPGNPNVWGAVVIQQPSIPTTTITGAWFAGSYGFVWNTGTAHDTFYVLVDSSIYLSSVQVNQGTVCQYGADTFSVDAYSNNTMNYQWYWDGQPRGTNSSKFIFNYLNPGDSVWVVASNTIGCVNGHLHADTIPASFTVSTNCGSAGPDQTICEYSIATMAATGTGRWSPLLNNPTPIGFNYNEFIPNNQVGPFNATGVYGFVWYLYPIGVSDTVYITVDTAPVPSGLLTAGTCVGSDTLILAGTAGADTIHWMLGGNIVHISAASDSVYIPTQPGLYTEYTSNNTGCSTQGSNTVPVSICNCNLHDSIGTSPALCSAIQYTAYLTGAVRPQYEWGGYTWYGGINVYGNPVEFYPVSWDQSYTVWVNVTDSATGCVLRTSIVMPAFFYDSVSYQNLGGNNYLLTGFPSSPSDSVEWTIDGQNYFRYGVDTLIVSVPVSGANIHFYDLNCGGGDSTISIPPIACSAGPDQTLCQFVDSVWMAATGTGTWTALSSNPQIVHITTPSSATTPISGSWSTGVYGFVWTSTCGNDTMTVTIDSSAGSFVTYASQPSVCVGHGDTFSVFIPILSDTIHWYNNGVAVGTNSPTYIVPSVTAGESIWAVITTPSGFCTNGHLGNRDTIQVSFTVTNCAPDTVWPGDADDNKLVDNRDLLTIGLGYDSIGPLRTVQGNVWQADLATDWAHDFTIYLPTVNYVHADCDGNGTINADDTAAIALNWGDTHAKTNDLPGPWRNGIPALSLSFSQDTVLNNDTLTVGIILGSNTVPVSNIYGLAFTFNYDPLVIDSNYSIFAFNSSWLGTASNSININRNSTSVGQVKAAITGIDHIARSGNGQIATFTAVITTGNINGKDWMYYHNLNYISDITAIDKYGDPVQLNAGIDSNYVGYFINGVQPLQGPSVVNVYPNPAATQVRVSADADITEIRIIDMIGEIIQTININGKKSATLGISQLAAGVYTVQVSAAGGSATAKLIVSR